MDHDKAAPTPLPESVQKMPAREDVIAQIKKEYPDITEEEMGWFGL